MTNPVTFQAQTKDPANASRIRDNQRRSRARRKEYVEELQRQVQEYEKQGVQASLDIQKAARDVSIENSRLRMLLAQRGVDGPAVDAYLQSFENSPHPDTSLSPAAEHPLDQQQQQQPVKREHSQPPPPPPLPQTSHGGRHLDPLSVLADASTQLQTSTTPVPAPHYSHSTREAKPFAPPPTTYTPSHPGGGNAAFGPAASPLQMSCNAAARIIADMQGHVDHRQARAVLGCSPYEQECVVNNINLFRILEQ